MTNKEIKVEVSVGERFEGGFLAIITRLYQTLRAVIHASIVEKT